ncbi:MAG: LssY C-terminal domain-containing protein [Planctomycetaceae bacterium]|nr:LssY C-terminal domain-containing protein [Planctomycetaceae bacterium]
MSDPAAEPEPEVAAPLDEQPAPGRRARERVIRIIAGMLLAYIVLAYALTPLLWRLYLHRHPALDDVPGITETGTGIPGDPLNIALVGTRADVESVMQAAGWFSADQLGLRSDLKIAADTVLERPYAEAPVSSLYLFGRKEDLAFEKPVGDNPRQRNHVRFWECEKRDDDGRPCWIGSATFDERVGLSHTTGQITHHVAADIDTERDHLVDDLQHTGRIVQTYALPNFHAVHEGRNGGGDPWHTDGALRVCVLAPPK